MKTTRATKTKKPKEPTIVVGKRIRMSVVKALEDKGFDIGNEIEKHLVELSGLSTCPTCGRAFKK